MIPMPGEESDQQPPAISEEELLSQVCRDKRVPLELIVRLRALEERYSGMGRRHGIAVEMRELIRQTLDDIVEGRS